MHTARAYEDYIVQAKYRHRSMLAFISYRRCLTFGNMPYLSILLLRTRFFQYHIIQCCHSSSRRSWFVSHWRVDVMS